MKVIIIGPSLSGKTTIVQYLRKNNQIPVSEIDEELTKLNNGQYPTNEEYKNQVLAPQIVNKILTSDHILFFTNTDYFSEKNLKIAKERGFKIIQLKLELAELEQRNKLRIAQEGYPDLSQWLKGMAKYQKRIDEQRLFDFSLDASLPTEEIVSQLLKIVTEPNISNQ
jgi:shikimate kinase